MTSWGGSWEGETGGGSLSLGPLSPPPTRRPTISCNGANGVQLLTAVYPDSHNKAGLRAEAYPMPQNIHAGFPLIEGM